MLSTRSDDVINSEVDLERGGDVQSNAAEVIVEKIELVDDVVRVSELSLSIQENGNANKLAAHEELTNILTFLATAREHQSKPIVGTVVTMLLLLASLAAFSDGIRRVIVCGDAVDCHEKIVPEFVSGVIGLILTACAWATTCHQRPEERSPRLNDLLKEDELQRVLTLGLKHDIRIEQHHEIHHVQQKFRGRLTCLNIQLNPTTSFFNNHRWKTSLAVTSETTPLLPAPGRASA